ncbi:ATP-binding protein [Pseudalkalibacillus sp. SCS-8]|uniref:ATP-binding protein n=1 Tax=Pseudalkalibacillus nanhaiensis TaxID=3115291 RepID=UPI0032DB076E
MIIKRLHIYGFGRFENYVMELEDNGVQVILGENESGKSTIMAFIEYMLFGFPKKSEKRLRYEPKTTQAYGGKLQLQTSEHGLLTIERKGGASGTVDLYNDNGEKVDPGFLRKILAEVNVSTFRNVFSFNLDGLQKVGEIKSEELGEYLFNAGLTGAQQLNVISDRLEEEQQKLFKPNGKNPLINQKAKTLVELDRQVKQWGKKLDDYNTMKADLEQKKVSMLQYEERKREVRERLTALQHYQSIRPLVEKEKMLKTQLDELPTALPFPEEGLERYRRLKDRLVDLESEHQHIADLIQENEESQKSIEIDESLLAKSKEIRETDSSLRLFKARQADLNRLRERAANVRQEIEAERESIGTEWTGEKIRSTNTDLVTKQQLLAITKQLDELEGEQKRLDRELEQARMKLEENEKKLEKMEKQRLPEEEIQAYREKLTRLSHQSPQQIREQIQALKDIQKTTTQSSNKWIGWSMISLGMVVALMMMILGDRLIGLVIGVSLIGLGFILQTRKETKDDGISGRIRDLNKQLDQVDEMDVEEESKKLNDLLLNQQQITLQIRYADDQTEELERNYQQIARRYDQWELDYHRTQDQLNEWRERFSMPKHVPYHMLVEIFERIDRIKQRYKEKQKLEAEMRQIEQSNLHFIKTLEQLLGYDLEGSESIEVEVAQLTARLDKEMEHQKNLLQLQHDHEELCRREEAMKKKLEHYLEEADRLFKTAEVDDEEAYWAKGKANVTYHKLMEELRTVQIQLDQMSSDRFQVDAFLGQGVNEIQSEIEELAEELEKVEANVDQLRDESSTLQANLAFLEEDGTYSEQLHQLEAAKSEFAQLTRKWSIYRTAQYALNKAKQNYQAERQPKVIQRAETYFSNLTEGRYSHLIPPNGEESFLVERKDTLLFNPEELSRATKEQLYLALRFALAQEYESQGVFPFVLDDILVNFDVKRRTLAARLIEGIGKERQILYFTCHEETAGHLTNHPYRLKAVIQETQPN